MGIFKKLFSSAKEQGNQQQASQAGPHDSLDWGQLTERAMEALRMQSSTHDQMWGFASAAWNFDMDSGTIVFESEKGYIATAPMQIVGTYDTVNQDWLWGWDHPSVPPQLAEHAKLACAYGQKQGHDMLTTRKLSITEDQCWELAAVASLLAEAQGVYRCPSEPTLVFVTFGKVQLSQSDAASSNASSDQTLQHLKPERPADQVPKEIADTVLGFIQDYDEWNQKALDAGEVGKLDDQASEQIDLAHKALVSKWYSSHTQPQPYSYGSDSTHDLASESIVGATLAEDSAVVFTKHTGAYDFVSDYEYHLVQEEGVWKLRHLYYVDSDGKYECL